MSLRVGIIGLPNVGKSTLFQALTSAPAQAANYPFCTIEPNVGVVDVPDERLDQISEMIPARRIIPASMEFVDIAGLVKGASQGEGLGNKFLSHIREVAVMGHVVRCFDDEDIIHVNNTIDPIDDIDTIHLELALADLESVEKRKARLEKQFRVGDPAVRKKAMDQVQLLQRVSEALGQGLFARTLSLSETEREIIQEFQLITMKPQIYLCNVDEKGMSGNEYTKQVLDFAKNEGSSVVIVCAKLESDIAALPTEAERKEFREASEIKESGLNHFIQTSYALLGLRTFFTVGEEEDRAWTFHEGDKAPVAAGVIHTDFERGFIKAEIYSCYDLFELGNEQKVREAGRMRMEGKDYLMQDGDVVFFKFNV